MDAYEISLPEGAEISDYGIEVGLYLAETGQRLGVMINEVAAGDVYRIERTP